MSTLFICNFCGRQDFRSKRGLALHQSTNKKCHAAIKAAFHIPSQMNFPAFHSDKATALKPAKQAEEVGNTTQIQSKSTPEKTGVHSQNVASYPRKRDFDAFQDGQEADLMNMSTSEDSSNIPEGVVEVLKSILSKKSWIIVNLKWGLTHLYGLFSKNMSNIGSLNVHF